MPDCNDKCFPFAHAAKVGKTSLIMSLVSEEFPDEVSVNKKSDDECVKNHSGSFSQLPPHNIQ